MNFFIEWKENSIREMEKLDKSVSSRIFKKVEELKENFLSCDIKKLKGREDYRLRVGDYRVIFELTGNIITVTTVGHRSKIYSD